MQGFALKCTTLMKCTMLKVDLFQTWKTLCFRCVCVRVCVQMCVCVCYTGCPTVHLSTHCLPSRISSFFSGSSLTGGAAVASSCKSLVDPVTEATVVIMVGASPSSVVLSSPCSVHAHHSRVSAQHGTEARYRNTVHVHHWSAVGLVAGACRFQCVERRVFINAISVHRNNCIWKKSAQSSSHNIYLWDLFFFFCFQLIIYLFWFVYKELTWKYI